jgi:hypothetical protein
VSSDIFELLNVIRDENARQHADIVSRLDQINGRVQRHDRELGEMSVQLDELHAVHDVVDRIDRDHVTQRQAWVVGVGVVTGTLALLGWVFEHAIRN